MKDVAGRVWVLPRLDPTRTRIGRCGAVASLALRASLTSWKW